MDLVLRGRRIEQNDLDLIRSLLGQQGHRGRTFVSRELCRRWNWTQWNGALKDAACRAILLQLQDRGLVKLPPRIKGAVQGVPQWRSVRPPNPLALSAPSQLLDLFPTALEWRLATQGPEAFLYQDLIEAHHYLGYRRPVGHHLRYIAYALSLIHI